MSEHRKALVEACRKVAEQPDSEEAIEELFARFMEWPIDEMPEVGIPGLACISAETT